MINKMPSLFIGHGSPMNAIEDNEYTRTWREIAAAIPRPEAILAISAHWVTEGTRITDDPQPRTIYDMYGFPKELYEVAYRPAGAPLWARRARELIGTDVQFDTSWGIDHGTWSVLNIMYPQADVPVFQMSLDNKASAAEHFAMGKKIKSLREQGIMIFGSGNVVHNLAKLNWGLKGGFDWAVEFDEYIKGKIIGKEYQDVIDYKKAGKAAAMAFYTTEHFNPLLYVLGAAADEDQLAVYNDSCTLGSLSMTCYLFR